MVVAAAEEGTGTGGAGVAAGYTYGEEGEYDSYAPVLAGGGDVLLKAAATIRHVALEPLHPTDALGIIWRGGAATGGVQVDGFAPVLSNNPVVTAASPQMAVLPASGTDEAASAPLAPGAAAGSRAPSVVVGAAEESDLVRPGDYLLGISGVCTAGFEAATVDQIMSVARGAAPGGLVVLHLCDVPLAKDLVEDATLQMVNAAAQLLQSRSTVETIQQGVYAGLVVMGLPGLAVPPGTVAPPPAVGVPPAAAAAAAAAAAPAGAAAAMAGGAPAGGVGVLPVLPAGGYRPIPAAAAPGGGAAAAAAASGDHAMGRA